MSAVQFGMVELRKNKNKNKNKNINKFMPSEVIIKYKIKMVDQILTK